MFKAVPPKPNITQIEDTLVRFWKTWHIAEKCEEQGRAGGEFVYYEKPSSPHSKPALSHAITRAMSDIFLRYKAMRGYHILRHSGWQAHGLPMELMVARQLGITSKEQIEEFGIDHFVQRCRDSLDFYSPYWERMKDHLAYWANPQDAYVTFTNEYIESVWWAIKSLWDKGLLYQTLKVMPYCPACGVHLSDSEVSQHDYEASEIFVCIRLPLVNGPGTSLLVLTKAPWSLMGNVAVAVNPEAEYITIEQEAPGGGIEHLIVAQKSANKIFGEASLKIVDRFKGRKLKGEAYFPLYTFILPQKSAHFVVVDECVREDIGTGLMHVAPTFDEQDLHLAQQYDLPMLNPLTDAGAFIPEVRPWSGKFFKDADPFIVQDLDARGLLFGAESHLITQPHCSHCGSPLLDYAGNCWFIRFSQYQDELSGFTERMIEDSGLGEEASNLLSAEKYSDQALSHERFWGAPLPIWECQTCHHQICVGSVAELAELAGKDLNDLDLHSAAVDEIYLKCPECGGRLVRIPELVQSWFETSCMPFAQWHYPFENKTLFDSQFPADLVCTSVGKTDGWLAGLHAVNGLLFEKASFREAMDLRALCVVWQKGNAASSTIDIEPLEIINRYGADVFRWHLCDCWQPFEERRTTSKMFAEQAIKTAQKTIFLLWDVYSFFVAQANQDDWRPADLPQKPRYCVSDKWLRSELHMLILDVTTAFDFYAPHSAVSCLQAFIENLSRWYIRQSRLRFGKRKMDADKAAAYAALYETLVALCKLCAPLTPFLAEEMYQNLAADPESRSPVSVHLSDWPIAELEALDEFLVSDMEDVMRLASLGQAARNRANIPVYQPLAEIVFLTHFHLEKHQVVSCIDILKNDLNVKQVQIFNSPSLFEEYQQTHPENVVVSRGVFQAMLVIQLTPELIEEGAARQVILKVKALRKQAELGESEPVRLYIQTTPELSEAAFRNRQAIIQEAVVDEMVAGSPSQKAVTSQFEINGESIVIGIEKH